MTYDEKEVEKEREKNKDLIKLYREWLANTGLKEKTINKHVDNVAFYINEFLLHDEVITAADGISSIGAYFDWFLPRKTTWGSIADTKETIASLKKFYKCMLNLDFIEQEDYDLFLIEIKISKEEWLSYYIEDHEW